MTKTVAYDIHKNTFDNSICGRHCDSLEEVYEENERTKAPYCLIWRTYLEIDYGYGPSARCYECLEYESREAADG